MEKWLERTEEFPRNDVNDWEDTGRTETKLGDLKEKEKKKEKEKQARTW